MPPNASAPAAAAASMPVKNNGFGPVIKHMDTLKELLDKLSAKLRGVSPNNGLGTNPLEAIQVNQNMRVAQNAAAVAGQKIAAHNLNQSTMLGNAARNNSKQAANMRAKTEGKGPLLEEIKTMGANPVLGASLAEINKIEKTRNNKQKNLVKNEKFKPEGQVAKQKRIIEAKLKKTRKNRKSSRKNTRRN
jgi:hypothetical protein